MAVTGKGKQIAGKSPAGSSSSKGKRPMISSEAEADGGHRRKKRRSGVLKFFETDAAVADSDSDSDSDSDFDSDLEPETEDPKKDFVACGKAETKFQKGSGKSFFSYIIKDEQLSGDELEEIIKDRYGRDSEYVIHTEDRYGRDSEYVVHPEDSMEGDEDSIKRPPIWRVKCMVGKERQMAFSLMQKFVDLQTFGTKLQIISVFCLDHVKGFVYIEADKACDVAEACNGFCNVYSNRTGLVPRNEVPHLLSVRNKACEVSKGTWVRVKTGKYKGDLAWVAAVDEIRKRVTIKLVPRVDLQSIAQKFGGGISLKQSAVPSPRLISSRELENFRTLIETRRDRDTGEVFEILDGMMLKDGYVYKKVAISSLVSWGVEPSKAELLKFTDASNDDADPDVLNWVSSVYDGQKKTQPSEAPMEKMPANQGSGFDLYDLVLFGQKSFGVIVAVENDCFQILKGDGEVPEVVRVERHEIKRACADKMFTACDHQIKTISINDTIKVLQGPHEGRQGIVRHMFKGSLFVCDVLLEENGGFFCVQSKLCENLKESAESKSGRPRSSFSQSSTRTSEQPDTSRSFNQQRQSDGGQGFSIGETMRIRKGPLKGYLCRVVGVYRSDVTVKLDSLGKVITVQAELLCPSKPMGGPSETVRTVGTQEWQSIGDLSDEVRETQAEKSSWGTSVLPSLGSDTWQAFSTSIAREDDKGADTTPGVNDVWGTAASGSRGADNVWGSKPASDARDITAGVNDAWGSAVPGSRDQEPKADDVWGIKSASGSRGADDAWGNKAVSGARGEEQGADPWGIKNASGTRGQEPGANDTWGRNAASGAKEQKLESVDTWGSKAASGSGEVIGAADAWGIKPASGVTDKVTVADDAWGSNSGPQIKDKGPVADDAWGSKSEPQIKGVNNASGSKATSQARVDSDDAWGSKSQPQNTGADDAWGVKATPESRGTSDDAWGSKANLEARGTSLDTLGSKSTSEPRGTSDDAWGSKVPSEPRLTSDDAWGSKVPSEPRATSDDAWGSKITPEPLNKGAVDAWGGKATSEAVDAWGGKPTAGGNQGADDSWGNKESWAKDKEKSNDAWGSNTASGGNWNQQRDSNGGGGSSWGRGGRGQNGGRGSRDSDGGGRWSGGRNGGRGSKDQDDGGGSWSNSGGDSGYGSGRGGGRNGDSWGGGDRGGRGRGSGGRYGDRGGRGRGFGGRNGDRGSQGQDGGESGWSNSGGVWGSGGGGRGGGGRGRNGDRGSQGQDGGESSWSNSGGDWGSGNGRGGGGRGRGRGRGSFQSSDWNNEREKSVDGGFASKDTSWGNNQKGNWNTNEGSQPWATPKSSDGNQPTGWNQEASFKDKGNGGTDGVGSSWGGANPNSSGNWNVKKNNDGDKSVWNKNSAAGSSGGDWATPKTYSAGNQSSGNGDAGNSWASPKPGNGDVGNSWASPKSGNGDTGNSWASPKPWNSGRNDDQQGGWQGNTNNRGRGRGRNSPGGRWDGGAGSDRDGSGNGEQGRGGGRGRWSGEGRGGRNGGRRGRGCNWNSGFGASDEPTGNDGGGNGRTGSWGGGGGGSQGGNSSWGGGGGRGGSWNNRAANESTHGEGGWKSSYQKNGGAGGSDASREGQWGGASKGSSWGNDGSVANVGGPSVKETVPASSGAWGAGGWGNGGSVANIGGPSAKETVSASGGGWGASGSDNAGGWGSGGPSAKETVPAAGGGWGAGGSDNSSGWGQNSSKGKDQSGGTGGW